MRSLRSQLGSNLESIRLGECGLITSVIVLMIVNHVCGRILFPHIYLVVPQSVVDLVSLVLVLQCIFSPGLLLLCSIFSGMLGSLQAGDYTYRISE